MRSPSRIALSLIALPVLTLAVRADVLIVDAAGGGDFVALAPAVAAAAEGDTLLVRPGSYGALVIQGKSLRVAADPAGVVRVKGIEVSELALGQGVVLSGLESHVAPTLIARDSEGSIRVQGCLLSQTSGPAPWHGAEVRSATDVVFVGCTVEGGSDPHDYDGGHGLFMWGRSRVSAWSSSFRGGAGGQMAFSNDAGDGGHGVQMWNKGQLYAMGCEFRGAKGGAGNGGPDGKDGPGASIAGDGFAYFADVVLKGGGSAPPSVGPVQDLGVTARGLSAASVVPESSKAIWTVTGEPGDLVFLLRSTRPAHRWLPGLSGVLVLTLPELAPQFVGEVGASGSVDFPVSAPTLPPGVESVVGHYQVFVRTADGDLILGEPRVVEAFAALP